MKKKMQKIVVGILAATLLLSIFLPAISILMGS